MRKRLFPVSIALASFLMGGAMLFGMVYGAIQLMIPLPFLGVVVDKVASYVFGIGMLSLAVALVSYPFHQGDDL